MTKTRRALFLVAFATTIAHLGGCKNQNQSQNQSPPSATDNVPPPQASPEIVSGEMPSDTQRQQLLAAKDALFQRLSSKLMEAMSQGGPAAAIPVCQQEAQAIATTVAQEQNVKIGRVGVRTRNPENRPPHWAKALISAQTPEPTFAMLDDGRAAALLPIKLQAQCLMCHGPAESIPLEVKSQLAKLYPQDQAVGFKEGDLRGWFWVEM